MVYWGTERDTVIYLGRGSGNERRCSRCLDTSLNQHWRRCPARTDGSNLYLITHYEPNQDTSHDDDDGNAVSTVNLLREPYKYTTLWDDLDSMTSPTKPLTLNAELGPDHNSLSYHFSFFFSSYQVNVFRSLSVFSVIVHRSQRITSPRKGASP